MCLNVKMVIEILVEDIKKSRQISQWFRFRKSPSPRNLRGGAFVNSSFAGADHIFLRE